MFQKKLNSFLELAPKYIAAGSAPEIVIFFYIYLTTSLVAKILEMLLTFDSLAFFFLSKVQFFLPPPAEPLGAKSTQLMVPVGGKMEH